MSRSGWGGGEKEEAKMAEDEEEDEKWRLTRYSIYFAGTIGAQFTCCTLRIVLNLLAVLVQ